MVPLNMGVNPGAPDFGVGGFRGVVDSWGLHEILYLIMLIMLRNMTFEKTFKISQICVVIFFRNKFGWINRITTYFG